jgi:uncharacterized protein YdaU (DUF1376 family)
MPQYLAIYPWDVDRWRNSEAYETMTLAQQGAYMNLCMRAWQEQPSCALPNDDDKLWRKANARSKKDWLRVKNAVLAHWDLSSDGLFLTHPVVLDTFLDSKSRHDKAVASGRVGGRESARARRNYSKINDAGQATLKQLPSKTPSKNEATLKPPSPSPSPYLKTSSEPSASATKTSWTKEACDDWISEYKGTAPGGRIGKALKPIVAKNTWKIVRSVWRSYLSQTEPEFASPERFANTYGKWADRDSLPLLEINKRHDPQNDIDHGYVSPFKRNEDGTISLKRPDALQNASGSTNDSSVVPVPSEEEQTDLETF